MITAYVIVLYFLNPVDRLEIDPRKFPTVEACERQAEYAIPGLAAFFKDRKITWKCEPASIGS